MSPAAAKTASARALLALAVAAFLITGCGGGSEEETSAPTATSAASAPGKEAAQAPGGADPDSKSSAAAKAAPGAPNGSSTGAQGSGAQGQGQKRGPRIAAPKGKVEQAPTAKEVAEATVADISLTSPAIVAANGVPGYLSAAYTCDGKNSWPALAWSGVPAGTEELILYVMSLQPFEGRLFVDWAVAGLDPDLSGIAAGELPKGAVTGANGFDEVGYSVCPPRPSETYMFALYALPQSLALKRGFDAREVRKEILDVSGNVGLLPAIAEHR